MRNVLLVLLLTLSTAALAKEIKVYSEKLDFDEDLVDARFALNADMGRAWVEFDIEEDDGEDYWYEEKRAKVIGLTFDKSTQEIIYTDTKSRTVCATTEVKRRRITGRLVRYIRLTGNCYFDYRTESVVEDDGFDTRRVSKDILYLIIK